MTMGPSIGSKERRRLNRCCRKIVWVHPCVVIVASSMMTSGCRPQPSPHVQQIRIATGTKSGVYDQLGRALAEIYNARVPNVIVSTFETTGSLFNVRAIEEGRADLAFSQADV